MNGFSTFYDANGDLRVIHGWVMQPKEGVVIPTAVPGASLLVSRDFTKGLTQAVTPASSIFVGGSGRNLVLTGLPVPVSGAMPPIGFFRPTVADEFTGLVPGMTLTVTGPSAASISDGTNVVAALTTGGTAPLGSYASTVYGETTYNGGTPFTLTAAGEGIGSGTIPDCTVEVSAGSAMTGDFVASSPALYVSSTDANWTILIDPTGSADLLYLTTVVATRPAGPESPPYDPAGEYEATAAGKAAYNITDLEPVNGSPWRAFVQRIGNAPKAGYIYLEIVETAGVVTAVNGPLFATTLPAPATGLFYIPLAHSDGSGGVEPIVTGPLIL